MSSDYLEVPRADGGGPILLHRNNPPVAVRPHAHGKPLTVLTFINGIEHTVAAHWRDLADFFGAVVHHLDPAGKVEPIAAEVAQVADQAGELAQLAGPLVSAAYPRSAPAVTAVEVALPVIAELARDVATPPPGPANAPPLDAYGRHIHGRQVTFPSDGPPAGLAEPAPKRVGGVEVPPPIAPPALLEPEPAPPAPASAEEEDRRAKGFLSVMMALGGSPVPGMVGMWALPGGKFYSYLDYVKGVPPPAPVHASGPLPALPRDESPPDDATAEVPRLLRPLSPLSPTPPASDVGDDDPEAG